MSFEIIAKIFADIVGIDHEEITEDTKLYRSNEIERIDTARLIIKCEKKFRITIHDEDVHTFKSVGNLAEYIDKKLEEDFKIELSSDEEREAWYYQ